MLPPKNEERSWRNRQNSLFNRTGITAVELMPVMEVDPQENITGDI